MSTQVNGGMATDMAFTYELGVGVLLGARAMATAVQDLKEAETAYDAAEAQERLDLIIDLTCTQIRLYDEAVRHSSRVS